MLPYGQTDGLTCDGLPYEDSIRYWPFEFDALLPPYKTPFNRSIRTLMTITAFCSLFFQVSF